VKLLALCLAIPLLIFTGCVSPPTDFDARAGVDSQDPQDPSEPFDTARTPVVSVTPDLIRGGLHRYRLHTITIDPASTVRVAPEAIRPAASLILSPTPWRWEPPSGKAGTVRRRIPAGHVEIDDREVSPPVAPYWGIAFPTGTIGTIELYRQGERSPGGDENRASGETAVDSRAPGGTPVDSRVSTVRVGGFFPLVRSGRVVADAFPGGSLRAARVAIAIRRNDAGVAGSGNDTTVAVITVEGDRLFRPGVTTIELAAYLREQGFDTAINLDGGRSAFVQLPDGSVLPRRIPFRRIGPVGLVVSVVP